MWPMVLQISDTAASDTSPQASPRAEKAADAFTKMEPVSAEPRVRAPRTGKGLGTGGCFASEAASHRRQSAKASGSTTKDAAATLAAAAIGCAYLTNEWAKHAAAAADDILTNHTPTARRKIFSLPLHAHGEGVATRMTLTDGSSRISPQLAACNAQDALPSADKSGSALPSLEAAPRSQY